MDWGTRIRTLTKWSRATRATVTLFPKRHSAGSQKPTGNVAARCVVVNRKAILQNRKADLRFDSGLSNVYDQLEESANPGLLRSLVAVRAPSIRLARCIRWPSWLRERLS